MSKTILSLNLWCALCIEASFPRDEWFKMGVLADEWMEFIDSFPVVQS